MNLLFLIVSLLIIGAILSNLGRTWVSLLLAYLVVGVVGASVIYVGIESYRLSLGFVALAEQYDSAWLQFLLTLFDAQKLSDALAALAPGQRKLAAGFATTLAVCIITLPVVLIANSIYSAAQAEKLVRELDTIRGELGEKIATLTGHNKALAESVAKLNANVESQKQELQQLRNDLMLPPDEENK